MAKTGITPYANKNGSAVKSWAGKSTQKPTKNTGSSNKPGKKKIGRDPLPRFKNIKSGGG